MSTSVIEEYCSYIYHQKRIFLELDTVIRPFSVNYSPRPTSQCVTVRAQREGSPSDG